MELTDQMVKFGICQRERVKVTGARRLELRFEIFPKTPSLIEGQVPGKGTGSPRIRSPAETRRSRIPPDGELSNNNALLRRDPGEAFRLETLECGVNRCRAHVQLLGLGPFREEASSGHLPSKNHALDFAICTSP